MEEIMSLDNLAIECKNLEIDETSVENENLRLIKSRFGEIIIDLNKIIEFNEGLLGIPFKNFCLANFKLNEYLKILQSSENEELSFMVLPIYSGDGDLMIHELIEKDDILKAAENFSIEQKNLLVMTIVTIHNSPDSEQSRLSVNLRAPVIIDVINANGFQHVFTSAKYSVRHFIN